jgi:hypothetical protein
MNTDATSLSRLHDLTLPPAIPWWPLASGWYVLFGLLVSAVLWIGYRFWKKWHANAYRRAALRELKAAKDTTAIAELLRRTALAVVPRADVAAKAGAGWVDWLAQQSPDAMPTEVHKLLTFGLYARPGTENEVRLLRDYAAAWINRHRPIFPNAKRKVLN